MADVNLEDWLNQAFSGNTDNKTWNAFAPWLGGLAGLLSGGRIGGNGFAGLLNQGQDQNPGIREAPEWTPPQLMQAGENTQPGLLNRPYTNPWATRNPWNNT